MIMPSIARSETSCDTPMFHGCTLLTSADLGPRESDLGVKLQTWPTGYGSNWSPKNGWYMMVRRITSHLWLHVARLVSPVWPIPSDTRTHRWLWVKWSRSRKLQIWWFFDVATIQFGYLMTTWLKIKKHISNQNSGWYYKGKLTVHFLSSNSDTLWQHG